MSKAILIVVSLLVGAVAGLHLAEYAITHAMPVRTLKVQQSTGSVELKGSTCLQACDDVSIQTTADAEVLKQPHNITQE